MLAGGSGASRYGQVSDEDVGRVVLLGCDGVNPLRLLGSTAGEPLVPFKMLAVNDPEAGH
jgi:hypothetical protein